MLPIEIRMGYIKKCGHGGKLTRSLGMGEHDSSDKCSLHPCELNHTTIKLLRFQVTSKKNKFDASSQIHESIASRKRAFLFFFFFDWFCTGTLASSSSRGRLDKVSIFRSSSGLCNDCSFLSDGSETWEKVSSGSDKTARYVLRVSIRSLNYLKTNDG